MYEKPLLYGAGSEVVTPFKQNGDVDYDLLHAEITFMLDHGVTCIFSNGLASEFLMMTEEEAFRSTEVVLDACRGRAPVVANIYANSTYRACRMAERYKELGADALMIFTPYMYPYSQEALYEYNCAIGKATDLPVYICNVSDTSNKFKPDLIARIFADNPNFKGVKDGTQLIIDQLTLLDKLPEGRQLDLISGSDGLLVPTMMNGGIGIISLITTVFPDLVVETVKTCEDKEWDKALKLQAKMLRVREALKTGPFMAAYKYAARLTGRDMGYMRHPLKDVGEADGKKIEAILKAEGLI